MPTRPVPNKQVQAFGRAICDRIGLDPAIVGDRFDWKIEGDDELSPVTFTVYLPSDEVLAMFNAAGQP